MKEIGGYFELEYSNIQLGTLHQNAVKLNSARYCFEYILLAKKINKVYLPYYLCDVLLEPLQRNNISYTFYNIDKNLEIAEDIVFPNKEALLYINYFGIKEDYIQKIQSLYHNLIVDNSQALFAAPLPGIDTFYSLRKFVGVPDGAFLYTDIHLSIEESLPTLTDHLYKRRNTSAHEGYSDFKKAEERISEIKLGGMSPATAGFLNTYDFEKNKITRERNFLLLHNMIGNINNLSIDIANICGPLCYPLLTGDKLLREKLIANKVFIPTFWPDIPDGNNDFEVQLSENILPLPTDHRYNSDDMHFITSIISK